MAILDTYRDWRDIEITTLEAFRERQQSKRTFKHYPFQCSALSRFAV
ncbi:hypothetical protein [Klebsiella variicola]|nr:hypothetical protein [Klebsiella variicola]UHD28461.1 hypothetical protein LUX40_11125 [Klebsiella variicola subsp. variicola]